MAVPEAQFGHDHWKLLCHVKQRVDEFDGELDLRRMRCNQERHPAGFVNGILWRPTWGTRLQEGRRLPEHDDWDCLDDLEHAGFLQVEGTGVHPTVRLTPEGIKAVAALEAHRLRGGLYTTFRP